MQMAIRGMRKSMIPTHYKIIAAVLIIGASLSSAFLFGINYQKGKQAKQEVKVIKEQVENHNEDVKTLKKNTVDVIKKQAEHKKSLDRIPLVVPDIPCPDYSNVWNETITITNQLRFEN